MAGRHYGHGGYGHEQQPSYDSQPYGHPPAQQQQYQQAPYSAPAQPPQQPVAHAAPVASGPNYRWWIPSAGIRRDVIVADIQRYLGQDALVKPGNCPRAISAEHEGQPGYLISAYRNLTSVSLPLDHEMVQDLRTDSANFERSGARGSPSLDSNGLGHNHIPNKPLGNYQESQVHQSRQYWGPTGAESQAAAVPQPAASAYAAQPQPQHRYPSQASAAAPSQHYATASAAYDGYSAPTAYSHTANPSAFSASPAGSDASRNYTYGPNASSTPGYQPPAGRQADPRQADPTPRYAPSSQQYAQPTARYFGNHRPEFLVYD
ncbi:hypothetical protein FKW77_007871 [Venturia effusa]|uniref:Uncharacterized protein n=1 Tax=Venturia effusa TaxID=50376 RepID=A0A517L1P4_9PEZI|nr:hypothetical protein FKW77_007871 [Venturia effusa]